MDEMKDLLEYLQARYEREPLGGGPSRLMKTAEQLGIPPELVRAVVSSFATEMRQELADSSIATLTYDGPRQAIELLNTDRFLWPTNDQPTSESPAIQVGGAARGRSIQEASIPIR